MGSIFVESNNLLEIKNVIKKYGDKLVINNLTMSIKKNQIYGLIGENGSGKTTLLKMISDIVDYDSGTISFFDNNKCSIGLVLDENGLYSQYSVWFNMEFFARLYGVYEKEYVKKYINMVDLQEYEKVPINKLSKGLKRRVVLARALMIKPNLLLLDEAFDGLDIKSRTIISKCIQNWVKNENNSAIFVSHNIDEIVDLCSQVGIIRNGVITFEGEIDNIERMKYKHLELVVQNNEIIKEILENEKLQYEFDGERFKVKSSEAEADNLIEKIQNNRIIIRELTKKYFNLKEIYLKVYEGQNF